MNTALNMHLQQPHIVGHLSPSLAREGPYDLGLLHALICAQAAHRSYAGPLLPRSTRRPCQHRLGVKMSVAGNSQQDVGEQMKAAEKRWERQVPAV